jgi:ABC-type multidrug transport system fused ATPase/permease subunit
LIACGVSLLVLLLQAYRHKAGIKNIPTLEWRPPNSDHPSEDATTTDPWRGGGLDDGISVGDTDSVAEISLQKTVSHASIRELDKPKGEVSLVALEVVILVGQVGISAARLVSGKAQISIAAHSREASIAGGAVWGYILLLATLRLCFSALRRPVSHVHLWNHTAFLYGTQWFLELFVLRSAVIHPGNRLVRGLTIARFALSSFLFMIALFSRKGNKAVVLEYEKDLEPSHELMASVISLASFAWADAIVWRGYKKTLELSDVWNVNIEDKAALVLSHFRQIKKTNSLAVRLLWFFKTKLLIQGAWAMLGSVCLFLPTLLLKLILEYLEDPYSTPPNAAWLYVILLFLNGTVMAVANGQGLWMGRKISIQLRAIIVGEIYSKALRRKAAATAESESGKEPTKNDKQSFIRRLLLFGSKKKGAEDISADQSQSTPIDDPAKAEKAADVQANNGKIINLMSIDSFKVADICAYLHFLWAATPVQLVMAVTLLYRILGLSSFAGIVMMVLLLPLNLYIAKSFQRAQKTIMAATDARIHSTNEVLQNIRIIKYFAWERRFADNVNEKRRVELKALRKRYILWSLAATIWSAVPIVITFVSFFIYTVIEHKPLLPSVAFTAMSTFALLRIPLDQLADMVAHVQDSKVSVDRVDQFLNEEDTEKYLQLQKSKKLGNGETKIALEDATLTWGSKKDPSDLDSLDSFRLINITADFHIGQLNIIAGPTGSGKTSLLMALLGEMKLLKGNVRIPGGSIRQELRPDPVTGLTESVAYCAQQAWLVNDTIKENILFASPFVQQRYQAVITACALERDLEILDAGDKTLVGEKGIALSGGQKQRISLARALYCNSKHLLLDDCLSAVDSHTAKHIFEGAIMGNLMLNRTCILVTHNVTLTVPHSSYVVALENGKISAQGMPEQVIKSGVLGDELLKSRPGSRGQSIAPSRVASNLEEQIAKRSRAADSANGHANGSAQRPDKPDKKIVDTRIETKAVGSVKMTTITMYLRSMGPWYFWVFATFGFVATQVGSVATNVWIRQWANAYHTSQMDSVGIAKPSDAWALKMNSTEFLASSSLPWWSNAFMDTLLQPGQRGLHGSSSSALLPMTIWQIPQSLATTTHANAMIVQHGAPGVFLGFALSSVDVGYYLGIYALLGLVYVLICLSRELILFWGSLHASWKIHESLLNAILRAKFKFFDSTPLGQLMNRFSKDVQSIDQEVSPVAVGMIHSLASVITIVILISVITPGFLIAGVFIGAIYSTTAFFYIHSSRDLKRIESVQRSPLFQAFGETLSGVVTIRAYGDESRFLQENHNRVNTHNRPFIYLWATNRWLAFRIDIAGALVSFFTGVFVITNVGHIDAGAAGLSLSYAITFTENVLWLVRLYAANEQNMNAVERVKEYIDVEQEAPAEIRETKPAFNWPSHGGVQFIGYSTRYRNDLDFVLKNVSFNVHAGEKVGIVGRTGAGKSSLALALFRGLEAEEGKILIDDVDIGLIGLQDLREAITIVPQDPTLFTGTLRNNLDPFGIFTDEEIFTALRRVQLISFATKAAQDASGGKAGRMSGTENAQQSHMKDLLDTTVESGTATPASSDAPTLAAGPTPFHAGDGPEEGAGGLETGLAENTSRSKSDIQSSEATLTKIASNARDDNKNIFHNLSSAIAESGSNLSQGQRQLLCLARALLKSPRVLLMDEATASIDYATDSKIQETLRELKDNTIITIAHRLQTIIDYDKVLVLDKGEVIEYADPWELIQKENGFFRGMCETSGDFDTLLELARKAWAGRRLVDDT